MLSSKPRALVDSGVAPMKRRITCAVPNRPHASVLAWLTNADLPEPGGPQTTSGFSFTSSR